MFTEPKISMIDMIYNELSERKTFDNDTEVEASHEHYCKKYIYSDNAAEENERWDDFGNAVFSRQRRAFVIGFKTAIKLIMSCDEV